MNQYYKELYCFKDKKTGEYIGEDYDVTDCIEDAIGWNSLEQAQNDLKSLDYPDDYEIFKKIINITEDETSLPDYEVEYNKFWKDIIEDEYGYLNKDKVMRELYDYKRVMENCTKAYDMMTLGTISKPFIIYDEVQKIFNEKFFSKNEYNIYGVSDDLIDIFDDCDTKEELEEELEEYFNINER